MFKSLKDNYNYIPGDGSSPPLVADLDEKRLHAWKYETRMLGVPQLTLYEECLEMTTERLIIRKRDSLVGVCLNAFLRSAITVTLAVVAQVRWWVIIILGAVVLALNAYRLTRTRDYAVSTALWTDVRGMSHSYDYRSGLKTIITAVIVYLIGFSIGAAFDEDHEIFNSYSPILFGLLAILVWRSLTVIRVWSEITFAVRGNTDADFYSVRVQRGAADDVRRAFLDISRGDLEKGSLRPTPSAPAPHVIASPDSGAGARAINNGDDDDDEPAVTPIYPDA